MRFDRKTIIVISAAFVLAGGLATATTIITGDHPDGYALEPELLPSENINATNATLRANLEEMDDVYDAALVYWNVTDTTTGETIRGPANLGFEQGETVEADYVGLEPDAEYTVQAFTEPVVWDDDTLADNFVEKGLLNVPSGSDSVADSSVAMDALADDADAMEAVADDADAMKLIHLSSHAVDSIVGSDATEEAAANYFGNWKAYEGFEDGDIPDSYGVEQTSSSADVRIQILDISTHGWSDSGSNVPSDYDHVLGMNDRQENAGLHLVGFEVDLSEVDQITLWIANSGAHGGHYPSIVIDEDEVAQPTHGSNAGDPVEWSEETIDVSSYTGTHEFKFGYNTEDTERDRDDYWIGITGIEFSE